VLPHLHVNVAVYFAQMMKMFARIMANFSAFGDATASPAAPCRTLMLPRNKQQKLFYERKIWSQLYKVYDDTMEFCDTM